ncbi:MAG: OsmC family protein [Sphingomonadaceae bacterium]
MTTMTETTVNGIDTEALGAMVAAIRADDGEANVQFRVRSDWQGQTRSRATVEGYRLGGRDIARRFAIDIDEPFELCGANTQANPQEMLMAAVNACMMVGYVANCALRGIRLSSLSIEMEGELDLKGFLGLASVNPGYDQLRYTVRIAGDGTPEQFREVHEAVMATSPNFHNMARAIAMKADLVIG